MADIGCRMSDVGMWLPTSDIRHPTSDIRDLAKDLLNPLEYLLLYWLVLSLDRIPEFRQQVLLIPGKLCWNGHIHGHVKISAGWASALRNAATFDSKRRARLSAGWNNQLFFLALESGNHDMRAQGGLRKCNGNVAIKIVFAAFEKFVFLNIENDVQISGSAAFAARIAFTGQPHFGAGIHSGRDLQIECLFPDDAAFPVACMAAILDK